MRNYVFVAALMLLSGPAFAGGNVGSGSVIGCENGNPPNCDDGGGTNPPTWNVGGGAGGDANASATGGEATAGAVAAADATAAAVAEAGAVASANNTLSASGNDTNVSVSGDVYREAAQAVTVVITTACGAGFGGSDRGTTLNFAKGQSSFCKNLVLYDLLKDSDPERAAKALDRAYQVAELDANMTIVRQIFTLGLLGE